MSWRSPPRHRNGQHPLPVFDAPSPLSEEGESAPPPHGRRPQRGDPPPPRGLSLGARSPPPRRTPMEWSTPSSEGAGTGAAPSEVEWMLPDGGEEEDGRDGGGESLPTSLWFPDARPPRPAVTCAVMLSAGTLGAAWYDAESRDFRLVQVAAEAAAPGSHPGGPPPPPPPALGLLLGAVRPARVIASTASDPRLLAGLRAGAAAMEEAGGEGAPAVALCLEAPALFSPPAAARALEALRVDGAPAGPAARDGWMAARCGGADKAHQACAAGALVAVLLRDGGSAGEGDVTAPPPPPHLAASSFAQASLPGALLIDAASLRGLGVFADDPHPSGMLGSVRAKEGLSLAGLLLPRAPSPGARAVLRAWLARPSSDLATIHGRQAAVAVLAGAPAESADALTGALRSARDPAACLRALVASGGRAPPSAVARCLDSWAELVSGVDVVESGLLDGDGERGGWAACPPLARLVDAVRGDATTTGGGGGRRPDPPIPAAQSYLAAIFDPASLDPASGAGPVATGIMPALDAARAAYAALPAELDAAVGAELGRLGPRWAPAIAGTVWSAVYLPQIGFLLRVQGPSGGGDGGGSKRARTAAAWALPPDLLAAALPDFERAYAPASASDADAATTAGYASTRLGATGPAASSAALAVGNPHDRAAAPPPPPPTSRPPPVAYYRTTATRALDARHGDILHAIADMEAAIIDAAARAVAAEAGRVLDAAATAAAEVGALSALASAARDLSWTRPTLVRDPVLDIVRGRHPLAEAALPPGTPFIPNDTAMAGGQGGGGGGGGGAPVNVVTGPNGSGKSVYARQVGLIVHLAHMGAFVPADAATVGLADRLFFVGGGCGGEAAPPPLLAPRQRHGAFAADLARLAAALTLSTHASVILIDEVGAGTLAADGAGLVCASLAALSRRSPRPPRTVATSHYSEVLDGRYLDRRGDGGDARVACWTLGALPPPPAAGPPAPVGPPPTFLRRLVPAPSSDAAGAAAPPAFGLACASAAGLAPSVIARAGEVMRAAARGGGGGGGGGGGALAPLPAAAAAAAVARVRAAGLAGRLAALEWGEGEGGGLPSLSEEAKAVLLAALR